DKKLLTQALVKFFAGLLLTLLLLFPAAGTWGYWQGWLLIGVLFVPMLAAGLVMLVKSPALLAKRLELREKEAEQRGVILASGLMFIAVFLVAGFTVRFGWITLPGWLSVAAAAVFLLGYGLFAEVLRENAWLSRTVEVQEGQKVVDTGLYGLVRHPMYMSTLLLFLSMPLILGSPLSFLIALCYLPILSRRIQNEEKVLEAGLEGYREYEKRVKYRVIPYIW
ncbi:MAG: methyltransferase family protein, partial [bacterium]